MLTYICPDFFYRAFGKSTEDFDELLTRPHHFIFNREWYEKGGGKPEFEDYQIQGIPCTYYIDKKGKIIKREIGFAKGNEIAMEQLIVELIK